jgi:FGAM-synthase: phosphoribosylformylglycinamidine synthase
MSKVKRVYVEKKQPFAVTAKELTEDIKGYLEIDALKDVRVLVRYDVENISDETYNRALTSVFSEPPVDNVYEETFPYDADNSKVFSVEFLPGQFDQRADSAVQCVKFLNEDEEPVIKTATTYVLEGNISDEEFEQIKNYCINPVDSRETGLEKPETLVTEFEEPADVIIFDGFKDMAEEPLKELYDSLGLAMTFKDFLHIQNYYKNEENRDPSMTEIRVLDTYWSDHCRHTTFNTELTDVTFDDGYFKEPIEKSYQEYLDTRKDVFGERKDKFVCLMDLALIAMRKLKKEGKLDDQEKSDEINACSIVVPVEVDGKTEEWLVNFKNETHNHPTEIEPFGGAATCLGGAIRDPLSGRTYVYQAMRVTGAADPTKSMSETLPGKLPQKKLVQGAANGYSSYGNQIGLATGLVKEIYHPDYVAKRMEIGAVMGAAPRRAVQRLNSDPGDIIILLGGRTGRDGCGGATGSSKIHTEESIETCGAEVQKGNAPTERKLQRLFRREEVSHIIKKCNDFGAGGVSVAIGELADGLHINLDKVPKKYAGLDGTEIAISESQERMAVVVDKSDVDQFLKYANEENLEATVVAEVTEEPRLVLEWRGKEIVNLSRAFLDTNGAHQETTVEVDMPDENKNFFNKQPVNNVKQKWLETLSDLNVCSQKGLVEKFDGSIGAGSVFMPFGGKYQMTETQTMVAKLPVLKGDCDTVTMMSYGFDPYLSSWSPYHGAMYAVVDSIAKIVATGGDYKKVRMTYQEYFRRMTEDPRRWSQPFAALLGSFDAQMGFGLPSIGGKDSMSGTFNDIDVPPTLVSFAVDVAKEKDIITPEFKAAGNKIVKFEISKDQYDKPVYDEIMKLYDEIHEMIQNGVIISAYAVEGKGVIPAVSKMAFGNKIGVSI